MSRLLTPLCLVCITLCGHSNPVQASANLIDALGRDSETTLHLRSHYLQRDRSWQNGSLAWAAGGSIAYRSGLAWDHLRLGLTAYTSQKLHGPADKDGTALLLTGQHSYGVLGEAFAAYEYRDQKTMAGRFLVNQYEVNPQDSRMTPRTFQGFSLNGKAGGIHYYMGRLDKMKSRNWDYFENVATVAGAPAGTKEPMYLISLRGEPAKDLSLGFATYHVPNVLTSSYADASWLTSTVGEKTRFRLGGQFFKQGSTGNHLLTGSDFDTWSAGVKADLLHGPLTLSAIFMKTDRGAAYRMPFGTWPGYANRIINNFNRAGERALGLDANVDCASLGIPGLNLNGSVTVGDHAINSATGIGLSKDTEYDLTADYQFATGDWPQWLKPVSLRGRVARFEQKTVKSLNITDEYQFIIKYTHTFK